MDKQNVFNHALYHLVTHWAAVIAVIVWLLTVGMVLGSTGKDSINNKCFFYFAILAAAGMAIYFLIRMYIFGTVVNANLPPDYVRDMMLLQHPYNLVVGGVVVVFILAFDLYVLHAK
jgi:hypothetical protein